MITVISRPLGHKLTDASVEATVSDSSGEALFSTDFAHGLVDGDYIWVQSIIESYNGYKYVDSIAYNEFKLKESENGDYVPYKQSVSVDYRVSVLQHGWLAVWQPIVYELESNLWPNNLPEEAYTPRTVASQADAEGYTQLNLTSALIDPMALDFIELVGDGDLAGVYQITRVLYDWSVVINLAYSASNSFSGYTVVKYYNNYCINVDIYSGLGVEHPWYSEKPYSLAATLRLTPDSEGKVKFSISDILKGYIHTRNNLTLDTLPNNLDFMTAFYIQYYESYDISDGEEITTYETEATSDIGNFEGHAVNADMPFKSIYISHMSEYLNEDTYLAKWLTLQETPYAVVGYPFDISYINSIPGINILVNIDKQNNGVVIESTTLDAELDAVLGGSDPEEIVYSGVNPGVGIMRIPIVPESGFDQYCIRVYRAAIPGFTPAAMADFLTWSNINDAGPAWAVSGALVEVDTNSLGLNVTSDKWYSAYAFEASKQYSFDYNFDTGGIFGTVTISILSGMSVLTTLDVAVTSSGVTGTYTFTAPPTADGISIHIFSPASCGTGGGFCKFYIMGFTNSTPSDAGTPEMDVTETICIKILEECDNTFIQDDDIRLTEDGDFRILE